MSNLVIEAAIEDTAIKCEIFRQAEAVTPPEVILASNTSSIPITKLAAATKRSDAVIGMHFMNPPPLMRLVEIIRGAADQRRDRRARSRSHRAHGQGDRLGQRHARASS